MASVEDVGVGCSEGPRSYRSGDGTALYGTGLPVTAGREALGMCYDYELLIKSTCVMHLLSAGAAILVGGGSALPCCTSSISKLSYPDKSSSVSGTSRAQTPNPDPFTVVQTTVPASSGTHSTVRSSKYGRAIHRLKPRLNGCICLRSYLSPSSGCGNVRR